MEKSKTNNDRPGSEIQVQLQPAEKIINIPRRQAKNVAALLKTLGLKPGTALVIRDGILLTPDVQIMPNQSLIVRTVMSSG